MQRLCANGQRIADNGRRILCPLGMMKQTAQPCGRERGFRFGWWGQHSQGRAMALAQQRGRHIGQHRRVEQGVGKAIVFRFDL